MARIDYDLNNNPVRIQITNGSVTKRQEICEMRPRPARHGMSKEGRPHHEWPPHYIGRVYQQIVFL